jgi:hypothetical protein
MLSRRKADPYGRSISKGGKVSCLSICVLQIIVERR